MKNNLMLIALVFSFFGCDSKNSDDHSVIYEYRCSKEQLEIVEKEVEICKNTDYLGGACYRWAKHSHCEPIQKDSELKKEQE